MSVKIISEFAKLPHPLSEWTKGLVDFKKSGGKVVWYMGRRRTNSFYYYLKERDKTI